MAKPFLSKQVQLAGYSVFIGLQMVAVVECENPRGSAVCGTLIPTRLAPATTLTVT